MKTLIDIDETLIKEVMRAADVSTKKAAVEHAFHEYLKMKARQRLKQWGRSGVLRLTQRRLEKMRHEG